MSTIEELWSILKLDPEDMNLLVKEKVNVDVLKLMSDEVLKNELRLPLGTRFAILNHFKKQEAEVEKEKPKKKEKERGPLFVIESGAFQVMN